VGAQCDAFWDKRQMILDALGATRASDIAPDFMDIAIFAADVRLNLSENLRTEAPEDALKSLQEAEAIFGPNPVLQYERRAHASTAAPPDAAAASSLPTAAPALQSPWEHYALGRALMRCGDLSAAARELARALELEPAGRWPNFYYGVCAYRMKRYDEAISAFSVCIGSAPNIAACFYNRALAYSALGHDEKAFRDYDRALQIDPTHAHSALNRGVLHLKQGHHQAAIADLNVALQYGADAATANYDLALAYLATNNPTLALEHSRRSLKVNPTHEAARQLRDSLEQRDAASGRKSGG
jgi:tetratricopeptide (TPR) repeat protein